MSFLRHKEIYRSDVGSGNAGSDLCHLPALIGFDEFPADYSLAGCSPAEPASASPATTIVNKQRRRHATLLQRTATTPLIQCLSKWVHPSSVAALPLHPHPGYEVG